LTKPELCHRHSKIQIGGKQLEHVGTFPYLRSLITADTECTKEIGSSLATGHSTAVKLKKNWENYGMVTQIKIRLMEASGSQRLRELNIGENR